MPRRPHHRARPLRRAGLPRHRHRRQLRRRRGLRPPAGAGCGDVRPGAGHRRDAGGGPEVDVRHHVQAAACGEGVVSRAARGPARGARLHQPAGRGGMPAGLRPHPQPGLPPRARAGGARGRLAHPPQPLQIPCRLLPDPRADRGRPQAARTARPDAGPDRADQPAARRGLRPGVQHPRAAHRAGGEVLACA